MTRGLRIDVDGTVTEIEWAPEAAVGVLQEAVGGIFANVDLSEDLDMWVNDEGLYLCEPNQAATNVVRTYLGQDTQPFHGPAVFTGGVDEEGDTLSIGGAFLAMVNADRF